MKNLSTQEPKRRVFLLVFFLLSLVCVPGFAWANPTQPDLKLTSVAAPYLGRYVSTSGTLDTQFTIQNTGTAFTTDFRVSLYFCKTTAPSSCSLRENFWVKDDFAQGQSRTYRTQLKIYPSTSSYFRAVVDGLKNVAESDETNNEVFKKLSYLQRPDLTIVKTEAPYMNKPALAGGTLTVQYTVRNLGTGLRRDFYVNVSVCPTQLPTKCVVKKRVLIRDDFSSGLSKTYRTSFVLSSRLVGTNYVQVVVDGSGLIIENNEGNNTFYDEFTITTKPDLTVTSVVAPVVGYHSISPGGKITVEAVVVNSGNASAAPFFVYFYHCTRTISRYCTLRHKEQVKTPLAPKGGIKLTPTFQVAAESATFLVNKTHYIRVLVDATYAVTEFSENNNDRYDAFSYRKPYLSIASFQTSAGSAKVAPGDPITFTYSLKNLGGSKDKDLKLRVYISTTTTSLGQLFFEKTITDTFYTTQSRNYTSKATLPAGLKNGVNYLHAKLERGDGGQNSKIVQLNIMSKALPDLTFVPRTSTPPVVAPGGAVVVTNILKNAGTKEMTANIVVQYTFCATALASSCSVTLGTQTITQNIKAGASYTFRSTTLKLPVNAPVGLRYIRAFADSTKLVIESNENNNDTFHKINVKKVLDLKADSVVTPSVLVRGKTALITYRFSNLSQVEIKNIKVRLVYSIDSKLTSTDPLLRASTIVRVLGGKSFSGRASIKIPAGVPAGEGYVFLIVDPSNAIKESVENNNTAGRKLIIVKDEDGDGFYFAPKCPIQVKNCDCNDKDKAIRPGAKELCDKKDNNCDGKVDEGLNCNPPKEPSPEPTPDAGSTPESGAGDGPAGGSCYEKGCPSGELCVQNKCVKDPCQGVTCKSGEFCRAGKCVKACGCTTCPTGEKCMDGACVADKCSDLNCASDEVCIPASGKCESNQCQGVTCGQGRVCDPASGQCVDSACNGVRCPSSMTCKTGQCVGNTCPPDNGKETGKETTTPDAGDDKDAGESKDTGDSKEADENKDTGDSKEADESKDNGDSKEDAPAEPQGCGCDVRGSSSTPFFFLFFLALLPFLRRRF